eukprot:3764217-Heterocapsa_arctica.AAC.1
MSSTRFPCVSERCVVHSVTGGVSSKRSPPPTHLRPDVLRCAERLCRHLQDDPGLPGLLQDLRPQVERRAGRL